MYQKIFLVGNLGDDPELRYTPSGQAVANFSVATNRTYYNAQDQKVQETAWFRVSAWGSQAEPVNDMGDRIRKRVDREHTSGRMDPRDHRLKSRRAALCFCPHGRRMMRMNPQEARRDPQMWEPDVRSGMICRRMIFRSKAVFHG